MSLTITQNALSTTAEKIVSRSNTHRKLKVKNHDASIAVFIGTTDAVTSSTGYQLKTNEVFEIENHVGELWAIAASGTPSVGIVEDFQ